MKHLNTAALSAALCAAHFSPWFKRELGNSANDRNNQQMRKTSPEYQTAMKPRGRMTWLGIVNVTLIGIVLAFSAACVRPTADSGRTRVRDAILKLVEEHRFQEARDFRVKNWGGLIETDEENEKTKLITTVVNPKEVEYFKKTASAKISQLIGEKRFSEARKYLSSQTPVSKNPLLSGEAFKSILNDLVQNVIEPNEKKFVTDRIAHLRKMVDEELAKGDDRAARDIIHSFGILHQPSIDFPVFEAKCAFLNALVNPATLQRYKKEFDDNVLPFVERGEYDAAVAHANAISLAPAYLATIDASLDDSGKETVALSADETEVLKAIRDTQNRLYWAIATRSGGRYNAWGDRNWEKVERHLTQVREALTQDDVPENEAQRIVDNLLDTYKHLVDRNRAGNWLTTAMLNEEILALRAAVNGQIAADIRERIAQIAAAMQASSTTLAEAFEDAIRNALIRDGVPEALANAICEALRDWLLDVANQQTPMENPDFMRGFQSALRSKMESILAGRYGELENSLVALGVSTEALSHANELLDRFRNSLVATGFPRGELDYLIAGIREEYEVAMAGLSAQGNITVIQIRDRIRQIRLEVKTRYVRVVDEQLASIDRRLKTIGKILADDAKLREQIRGKLEERNKLLAEILEETIKKREAAEDVRSLLSYIIVKAVREEAERIAKLRNLAQKMAGRVSNTIDLLAREHAFVDAVSGDDDNGLNRILGDAARAVRLHRAHYDVPVDAATSLLFASLYLRFDDTLNLAMSLGADPDRICSKDILARPAYLFALQFGYNGPANALLAATDRTRRDGQGRGALHYGIHTGNPKTVFQLLSEGQDARKPDNGGETPLMLAVRINNAEMVSMLLPFSDIDAADGNGFTALLRAAENGNLSMVRMLVDAKASLSAVNRDGDGVLELAILANAERLVDYLLDEKNMKPTKRAISHCVANDKVAALKVLLAHGAHIENEHLAYAVRLSHLDMVQYLVSLGCDVNASSVRENAENEIRAFLRQNGMRP